MAHHPFRYLHRNVRALLFSEENLDAEERAQNQWQLLVKFADTQVIVGKGGVNTIFYQFGADGARKVCFPEQILEKLERFAKRRCYVYQLVAPDQTVVHTFFTEKAAWATPAKKGHRIIGHTERGPVELRVAKTSIRGVEWAEAKSKTKVKKA